MIRKLMRRAVLWAHERIVMAYEVCDRDELARIEGLTLSKEAIINGRPLLHIENGATIRIDKRVVLNSCNRGYHVNMYAAVKLFADQNGACISIGENTRVHGSCLHAYSSITGGKNCLIAANCQIIDNNGHDLSFESVDNRIFTTGSSQPVVIEDSVWIGAGSFILPGVTIGRGSVIGAGSVVTHDIPPMVLAAGIPARIIRKA